MICLIEYLWKGTELGQNTHQPDSMSSLLKKSVQNYWWRRLEITFTAAVEARMHLLFPKPVRVHVHLYYSRPKNLEVCNQNFLWQLQQDEVTEMNIGLRLRCKCDMQLEWTVVLKM